MVVCVCVYGVLLMLVLHMCELCQAIKLCNETRDKAACYFLGQQFAAAGRTDDAIHFFTQAGSYGSAIRVCKVLHLAHTVFFLFLH